MKKAILTTLFTICLILTGFSQISKQQATNMVLNPIQNLTASLEGNDKILLTWSFPDEVDEIELTWSKMVIEDWVGTHPSCAWDVMQHFDLLDIRNLTGWRIKDITCVTPEINPQSGNTDVVFYIKVWKGDEDHRMLVYEQCIEEPIGGSFQTVTLNEAVCVDANEELWIGFYGNRPFTYPWAVDYSFVNGFERKGLFLDLYGENTVGDCVPNEWINYVADYGNATISATLVNPSKEFEDRNKGSLTGYRVYRNGYLIQEIPFQFFSHFTDNHFDSQEEVTYCVTAVYGEEESEGECLTIPITGVVEEKLLITAIPNPSYGTIQIDGVEAVEIQIYNTLGQLVKTLHHTNIVLLDNHPAGIYMLRISDQDGNVFSKKVIKR